MSRMIIFIALLLFELAMSNKSHSRDELPVLEDPYLGQKIPGLTPDGKYMFFNRHGDIYWLDVNIIETLRPKP